MLKDLLAAKKYITMVHHIKGRMRLKINPSIVKDPVNKKLKEISCELPGVINTRINMMARSVVLQYDPDIISSQELETLVTTKDDSVVEEIWNRYEMNKGI